MKLRLEVSLDDEWAAGRWNEIGWGLKATVNMLHSVLQQCNCKGTGEYSATVTDPNGNTIGHVEVIV